MRGRARARARGLRVWARVRLASKPSPKDPELNVNLTLTRRHRRSRARHDATLLGGRRRGVRPGPYAESAVLGGGAPQLGTQGWQRLALGGGPHSGGNPAPLRAQ
eukprot:scaffold19153_cov57-Phaeocystis_antarctica.AAC.3